MPVANLQTYRSVGLRVHSSTFASQGQAMFLEMAVLDRLRARCGFEKVDRAGTVPSDVIIDLNITNISHGGDWIGNSKLVQMDTLLVLSDGQGGDLLGTARIHGKSSGAILNSGPPENEAIDAIANTVADILSRSGCVGPRIARAQQPPPVTTPPPNTGSGAPKVDESQRAQAEALNQQGKEKLQTADLAGALAAFQQANTLVPDAKYQFNVCLAYEAQEQWSNAVAACKQARGMDPQPALLAKIDHRLDLLAHRQ